MENLKKCSHSCGISRSWRGAAVCAFFLFTMMSCSGLPLKEPGTGGVYHRVKSGETLSAIARAYHTDIQTLAEANNITDPSLIEKNSVLFIPHAQAIVDEIEIISREGKKRVQKPAKPPLVKKGAAIPGRDVKEKGLSRGSVKDQDRKSPEEDLKEEDIGPDPEIKKIPATPAQTGKLPPKTVTAEKKSHNAPESARTETREEVRLTKNIFIWPLKGKVVSFYGMQPSGMFFNGIRIAASEKTAIHAAADGVVIHSDFLKYYGETVIIQHAGDYATVYANMGVRSAFVKELVKKGERIGLTGGAAGGGESQLHFEIRKKNKARNPLFFLP